MNNFRSGILKSKPKKIATIIIMMVVLVMVSYSEKGEESGKRYSPGQSYEEVRAGVLLKLVYDKASSSFIGTVKNVSKKKVKRVRVEVHLSNKVELGPTKPINLAPGKQVEVKLKATGHSFTWWSAHAESGRSKHEHRHGDRGEHKRRENGEHGGRGEHG